LKKEKREKKYKRKIYKKDNKFRIEYLTKNFLYNACIARKNNKNYTSKYFKILGFSFFDFYTHFENLFEINKNFNWDNYGSWHIDHIKPKSLFNYSCIKDKDYLICWGLSNLQPMRKEENLKKYNKEN
jgi:hypothetical protein